MGDEDNDESLLSLLERSINRGDLGDLTYARFSLRHETVDLGPDITCLLQLAQNFLGPVGKIHTRGQWIGEAGALTLILDHEGGAVSILDASSASIQPTFKDCELNLRIEGATATAEILPGQILRISGQGWRREHPFGPANWREAGSDDGTIQELMARAMQSAETGAAL